jgi:hypothetical protein
LLAEDSDIFTCTSGNSKSAALWVDAICIDQTNLDERAQQVGIMDRIYSNAKTVIAWLGGEDSFLRPGLEAIIELGQSSPETAEEAKAIDPFYGGLRQLRGEGGGERDNNIDCVYPVLHRAWFRRAWIMQEAVLAKRMVFWASSITIPLAFMARAAIFLKRSTWWDLMKEDFRCGARYGVSPLLLRLHGAERASFFVPHD